MGDSLTWFGTGQGLALHNGHYVYSHQITTDSLADGQTTKLVPYGGIPAIAVMSDTMAVAYSCLLYTSPSPRDGLLSRMPSSA